MMGEHGNQWKSHGGEHILDYLDKGQRTKISADVMYGILPLVFRLRLRHHDERQSEAARQEDSRGQRSVSLQI